MRTYVKYLRNSDFGSRFGCGYIDGYLTDNTGSQMAVIVTRDKKIITRNIKSVDVITEQEYLDSDERYW